MDPQMVPCLVVLWVEKSADKLDERMAVLRDI